MTKRLLLNGFQIVPMVVAFDLEDETMDGHSVQPMQVPAGDLLAFVEEQWPVHWEALKEDFARLQDASANAEVDANRTARRASARKRAAAESNVTAIKRPAKKAVAKKR